MASRVELFEIATPAGTAIAAPLISPLTFDIGTVERFEILVPPGPSGLVGFGIMHSGADVLPRERSRWVKADGEVIKWDVSDMPTGSAWQLRSYNLDVYEHTLYIRVLVSEVGRSRVQPLQPLDIEQPNQEAVEPEAEGPEE